MLWGAISAAALACMAAGYLAGVLMTNWHRDRDEYDAQIEGYEDQLEANRAAPSLDHLDLGMLAYRMAGPGKHRQGQPRAGVFPPSPAAAPPDFPDLPGARFWPATATSLAPVFVPEPGSHRHQVTPPMTGRADTGTFPRVKLEAGTTGEMRALTDEFVAAIERGDV